MNTTRYLLAAAFVVGICVHVSSAHAATVVTHSAVPGYAVTTVTTTPYWGIQPAPCCYTRVVATTTSAKVVVATPPPPRVVVVLPPVNVYAYPQPVPVHTTYYYTH